MDPIQQGMGLGDKALALASKIFGPSFTRRQADADARSELQAVLTEQVASYMESHPDDPVIMDAIISCGGKFGFDNIARIARLTMPQLTDNARPDQISDDWAANWRDKAKTCSDPDMARLWASLLAGEADNPGSYSRKTVNVLGDMEKSDAVLFSQFCHFQLIVYGEVDRIPVILDIDADIYAKFGITRSGLSALETLSLVDISGSTFGGITLGASIYCNFIAHSDGILIFNRRDGTDQLSQLQIGNVAFTRTGLEMSNLCLPLKNPPGFVDWLITEWERDNPRFTVRKHPKVVRFTDGELMVRPDLGKIVEVV